MDSHVENCTDDDCETCADYRQIVGGPTYSRFIHGTVREQRLARISEEREIAQREGNVDMLLVLKRREEKIHQTEKQEAANEQ
ncbi:hypothetical protein [Streptomyces sp. NPDC048720]|uniref:hypothetical protein n=1 Tax=Streptomyces sp. NPDC048720 TaxID=3365588 RepID=UPI0037101A33